MAAVTFFSVFIVIFDQLAAAAVRPPAALATIRPNAQDLPEIKFKKSGKMISHMPVTI